ncbi:MAG: hypothetical protein K2X91_13400 [Thermoleophilia bacterium]|nr:hypothetical protein [Thermoleophilia bacterium]
MPPTGLAPRRTASCRTLSIGLLLLSVARPAHAAGDPVTPLDARGFAETFIEAVEDNDIKAGVALFDGDAFFERAMKGIEIDPGKREAFRRQNLDAMGRIGYLVDPLARQLGRGGRLDFLRSRSRDKATTALIRLRSAEGGITYTELYLSRGADGRVRAFDYYGFFTGEFCSQTIHRVLLGAVAFENRGVIARLLGSDREYVDSLPRIAEMYKHSKAGEFAEALRVRASLPDGVRRRKEILLAGIQIAQGIDEAAYLKAIDEFQAALPDDPCLHVHLIDGNTLRKKYDAALAEVDRLERSVGGDPCLDALRANIQLAGDRPDRARECAERLARALPDDRDARFVVIDVDLQRKDYPRVLDALKAIDRDFDLEIGDLAGQEAYAGFLKSPQYRDWLAYIKARDAAPANP